MRFKERLSTSYRCRHYLLLFALLIFATALLWGKARDPFKQIDFTLKTASGNRVAGIAVLPKAKGPSGTVVYLHGSRGSLIGSGNQLRQFAELGVAAVAIEYNQTNYAAFDEEFGVLNQFLLNQPWSKTNAIAWVGFSLGAQHGLSYVLKHPKSQPQLLVRLSGGWVKELEPASASLELKPEGRSQTADLRTPISGRQLSTALHCPVLLIHGEYDELFPKQQTERLAALLQTNGTPVSLKVLRGQLHNFGDDRALVFRLVAESCKSALAPREPLVSISRNDIKPHFGYFMPVLMLAAGLLWVNARTPSEITKGSQGRRTKLEKVLRWLAWSLAILALGETTFRCVMPRFAVTRTTLNLARNYFVPPHQQDDFACLSSNSVWQGKPLKALLKHVELANYNRTLVNWQIEDKIYKEYVLSPAIDSKLDGDWNWRRPLWENFYPRIRKESDPASAARVVVRYLRERVTVVPGHFHSIGIRTDWDAGMTDAPGFERLYAAALRSAGIGARLSVSGQVELWTGDKWIAAPRPLTL